MKKINTILLAIIALMSVKLSAQEQNYGNMISQNNDGTYFYMRSSLEMVYIDGGSFPKKDLVDKSWENYMDPAKNFPNQYNKHYAGIENLVYQGKPIDAAQMNVLIADYIKENKLANRLIQKWFNYNKDASLDYDPNDPVSPDAKLNMQTIFKRGFYNVNAGKENLTLESLKRDRETQIKDLSMKLIPFTFMTFTKLDFYENEPVARAIRNAAIVTANDVRIASIRNGTDPRMADLTYNIAVGVAATVYNATKDGYTLLSTTWLYRLKWDENTSAYFNKYVYENPELLETSDQFQMEYVDCQENKSTVIISAAKSQAQIVNTTLVRNLNKVFRDLQERNDVFKVWTPLLDFYSMVSPSLYVPITVSEKGVITANIGTEEGLRGGETFSIVDEDGNFYGFAEAVKGQVLDNAVVQGGDAACYYVPQTDKKGKLVTATTFKAKKAKGIRTGMYLCDPKAPKKMRIAARIGTKEGVEDGSMFHVYVYDSGTKKLKKVGIVTTVKGSVWDNFYYNSDDDNGMKYNGEGSEITTLKNRDKDGLRTTETLFKGIADVQPGMFIRMVK